jgi:hypothetical protein
MADQRIEQYWCHDASTFLMRHEGHQKIFCWVRGGGAENLLITLC